MNDFWKRKLAAYLHDPPSKALDIRTHGERSDAAFHRAGFVDTEIGDYFTHADHTGAAADRLPFPGSQSSGLSCSFDGIRNAFRHPLSGQMLPFHAEFRSAEQGIEGEESVQPLLTANSLANLADDKSRWRARFFAHWRLWKKHASEKDYRLALLPADTRIPDHSIWTHMQVVSALGGCMGSNKVWQPAFLKFQLGPVQDFIAAARSVRDLWSGSYLLSWLMAAGLKALSAEIGPDAVIFPNLSGQPLFDLHWRDELWSKVNIGSETVWESMKWRNSDLLTPNLPNVFLAVVPADRASELGALVQEAIQAEWKKIASAVWKKCELAGLAAEEGDLTASERKARFDNQIGRFLSLSWHSTPWPNTLEDAMMMAEAFDPNMPTQEARGRVQSVVDMATKHMPLEHRDGRYYVGGKDGPKQRLNNTGLGWSVMLAFNAWGLDGIRQTRHFSAANPGGWKSGSFNNKDALTGCEEAVAGGRIWSEKARAIQQGPWSSLFKHDDWLAAITLVKRLWHFTYLASEPWSLETSSQHFPMPDTRSIAQHAPYRRDDEEIPGAIEQNSSKKYFAVLALDGDQIGKWISGAKTPPFSTQLADYMDTSNTQRFGPKLYFEKSEFKDFLRVSRPLSPSYHLQFSEALSNFALLCAQPIVQSFDGRLIYAGGDDVVALLPADSVLECAYALRMAFSGREVQGPGGKLLFSSPASGFLSSNNWKDQHQPGRAIPFLVPGPAADCSVGIAMAHFKAPLQDVVRAAQAAEKRAKKQLGRSAVAVTLLKRSGETIEWGCKWESGGLELYRSIADALHNQELSSKFPYRLVQLLEPYRTSGLGIFEQQDSQEFNSVSMAVILQEFSHAVSRQSRPGNAVTLRKQLEPLLQAFIDKLRFDSKTSQQDGNRCTESKTQSLLSAVIGLCQAVAFANRTRD